MIGLAGALDRRPRSSAVPAAALGAPGPSGCWAPLAGADDPVRYRTDLRAPAGQESLVRHDRAAGVTVAGLIRLDDRTGLLRALRIPAAQRRDLTDHDLALRAYATWGVACGRHLAGDFAFVLWDHRTRLLHCFRDQLGVVPFYYALTPDRMVFATDLQLVAAHPGVGRALDEAVVAAHLVEYMIHHPSRTLLADVSRLPPGSSLVVGPDRSFTRRHWSADDAPDVRLGSDGEYVEAFRELHRRAVDDRLRGADAVGVHVSGGLDSSSIAVLAARSDHGPGSVHGFAWAPPRHEVQVDGFDERDLIEAVGHQADLPITYVDATADDFVRVLEMDVTRHPTVDGLAQELGVQDRAAELGVHVMFSGWGGDEFVGFNGRGFYADLVRRGRLLALYREGRARSARPWRFVAVQAAKQVLPSRVMGVLGRGRGGPSLAGPTYASPDLVRSAQAEVAALRSTFDGVGVRNYQLSLLRSGHLGQRIEAWATAGLRQAISYRYPLLDVRIVEFALGLPPDQYVRGAETRRLMRAACAPLLPAAVTANTDKSDPARSKHVLDRASEALLRVGRERLGCVDELPQARYLDLPRLRARLERPESVRPDELLGLWSAVQLLTVPPRT